MKSELLRSSLKLFTAAFITTAIAMSFERMEFVWYPLLAVVVVTDDNDDLTLKAASNRILGTAMGGLITFIVHTIVQGWPGVLVSLLVMVPVLRVLGWSGGLGTAGLLSVMFLMIPDYTKLDWNYVFDRSLDTVVGCVVAVLVGLLFWPRGALEELRRSDSQLRQSLIEQLQCYEHWLSGKAPRPQPLAPAPFTAQLERMEQLVGREQRGPRRLRFQRTGWPQRLRLWQQSHFHWMAWEQMLADLPDGVINRAELIGRSVQAMALELGSAGRKNGGAPASLRQWRSQVEQEQLPMLPLLAVAQEQQPLHGSLRALARSMP